MPQFFFRRPNGHRLFTGMDEHFYKLRFIQFLNAHMVEMNTFRRKRNSRHTDGLKELCADNLKFTQIKIAGMGLYFDRFQGHGRLTDTQ